MFLLPILETWSKPYNLKKIVSIAKKMMFSITLCCFLVLDNIFSLALFNFLETCQLITVCILLFGAITEFVDGRTCNAIRVEPILVGCGGNAYWKLNCSGKFDVLHQGK